jgi:hypothetical protein
MISDQEDWPFAAMKFLPIERSGEFGRWWQRAKAVGFVSSAVPARSGAVGSASTYLAMDCATSSIRDSGGLADGSMR